ncbi:MAG: RagB/SusD family nutrient uptake outer membrane protein [Bacteroidetes bacterium]|nr:RagB/SusD family nutrient uptake outer membrane protein [Bacteroidota bacterium]
MNTMNKTVLAACLALAVAGAGCKKYLNQEPITDVGPNMVFSDVGSTYKALAAVYSRLMGDNGYGIRISLYYPLDNDEMQGPTGAGDNDRRDIARYAATSGNAQLEKPFNQLFQGIEYANICIDNIPKMALYSSGSDQQKKQLQRMYGEALALRAQFYFEAIRNWGDLPAHFSPAYSLASGEPFPKKVDRDTLYNHLLADLKTAEDLVPWRNDLGTIGDAPDERLTKGSIKGLRARIALFKGGYSLRSDGQMHRPSDYLTYYQIARDEANDIINSGQHSLNTSFKSLWKDQVCAHAVTDPNGELMFQASASGGTGAEDSKLGYYNGPTVNGLGNKSVNVLPTYFYAFDSTDLRRDVTCAPYNVAANGTTKVGQAITAICDGKYRRDWISNPAIDPNNKIQYFGLKWQILRYSDVLLMFAEAENEINGPTTAAYNAVNMVRRRGYGKPVSTADATVDLSSGLSKSDLFTAIVKERSLELGGEGIRKYDLIRWNLLGTTLNNTKAALLAMSTSTAPYNNLPLNMYYYTTSTADDKAIWANSFYKPAPGSTPAGTTKVTWVSAAINTTALARFATNFTAGKSELLPLPQAGLDANINLKQNPGY